jgi:alpha-1,2-mannosyltransferase
MIQQVINLYNQKGFSSTLILSKILLPFTKTASYVHYPFISLDMIDKVKNRKSDFNNDQRLFINVNFSISNSFIKTKLKLFYYQAIFIVYKLNGYFVDFSQTNSTWTHDHMSKIWKNLYLNNKMVKLYPPCSVQALLNYKKNINSN